jgi:hypothetical protein
MTLATTGKLAVAAKSSTSRREIGKDTCAQGTPSLLQSSYRPFLARRWARPGGGCGKRNHRLSVGACSLIRIAPRSSVGMRTVGRPSRSPTMAMPSRNRSGSSASQCQTNLPLRCLETAAGAKRSSYTP